MKIKICKDCKKEKFVSEFGKHKRGSKYYQSYCRPCASIRANKYNKDHRKMISKRISADRNENPEKYRDIDRRHVLKKRGLTFEGFEKIKSAQNNLCAICGKPSINKNQHGVRPLDIDHNHNTNKTRGLLCSKCNTAIGLLGVDSFGVLNLEAAIQYIKKYATINSQVA